MDGRQRVIDYIREVAEYVPTKEGRITASQDVYKRQRDKRRANWKMSAMNLVKCSKCGALMMPHRVCKACGSYNKKEIIKVED